jgi:hypothetical protein
VLRSLQTRPRLPPTQHQLLQPRHQQPRFPLTQHRPNDNYTASRYPYSSRPFDYYIRQPVIPTVFPLALHQLIHTPPTASSQVEPDQVSKARVIETSNALLIRKVPLRNRQVVAVVVCERDAKALALVVGLCVHCDPAVAWRGRRGLGGD